MQYITTRNLQKYFTKTRCSTIMTMLQLGCIDTKMHTVIANGKGGSTQTTTIRHVNLDEAIMRMKAYLEKHKDNKLPTVIKSMVMKREVLSALEVIKNEQV